MTQTEYADALRDLACWVTGVVFRRYPATAALLPPCWPAHPAVVEELDWLDWDWTGWALDPDARSRDAADWHDRWLPGVLARIRAQLAPCGQKGRYSQQASQRHVPAELKVAGHAPQTVFIEQMAQANRRNRSAAAVPADHLGSVTRRLAEAWQEGVVPSSCPPGTLPLLTRAARQ